MAGQPDIDELIRKLYSAALDHEDWGPVLDCAAEAFGAVGTSFEIFDKKTGNPLFLELSSELRHVSAPDYIDYYSRISPRVRNAENVRSGDVSYDYAILSESEMDADEFYTDCMTPVGLRYFVAGHILDANGHLGAFAVQRSARQGHVETDEIDLMRRMLPHIQQAVDLKYRFADIRFRSAGVLESLEQLGEAVILIGVTGEVLHANIAAQKMFAADDGVELRNGRINFVHRLAARQLERALGQATNGAARPSPQGEASFIAHRSGGERPYLVTVRPLPQDRERPVFVDFQAAAVVFIRDPGVFNRLDDELLRDSYGMSPAELETAVALDSGQTISEIARRRGVAVTTVRSQVYSLMAKVSVSRQVDLVRILANYRRPFN